LSRQTSCHIGPGYWQKGGWHGSGNSRAKAGIVAALFADVDLQDIISLNLSRAMQISVDIGAHLIAGMEVVPLDTMG